MMASCVFRVGVATISTPNSCWKRSPGTGYPSCVVRPSLVSFSVHILRQCKYSSSLIDAQILCASLFSLPSSRRPSVIASLMLPIFVILFVFKMRFLPSAKNCLPAVGHRRRHSSLISSDVPLPLPLLCNQVDNMAAPIGGGIEAGLREQKSNFRLAPPVLLSVILVDW